MTRRIVRLPISTCLALGLMAATAVAAPTVQSVKAPTSSANPEVPADNPDPSLAVSPSEPAATPAESVPAGTPQSGAAIDAGAAPQVAGPTGPSPQCETEASGGWSFHPFAGLRERFAEAHKAPLLFPRYDGQPREVVVPTPGARVAAFVESRPRLMQVFSAQDGNAEVVEQPGPQGAEPVPTAAAEPVDGAGEAAPDGAAACCNAPYCGEHSTRWFGGSDYYLIRPHQTYDTAYELTPNGATGVGVTNVNFNPSFGNAVRVFAGYETSCDESLRFSYTYMFNDTDRSLAAPTGASILTPLGATLFPGDSLVAINHLRLNAFDFEDSRKLNLPWCACKSCCPAWDLNWSWGVRVLQLDDSVLDSVSGPDAGPFNQKSSYMGAGPRAGIDVHRRLGHSRFSAFFAGDAALLIGEEKTYGPTTPLGSKGVQAVPNFDLQIGLAWEPTCHLSVTSGYLFEFFGDAAQLSDSPGLALLTPPSASNISYDGFFFRGQFKY